MKSAKRIDNSLKIGTITFGNRYIPERKKWWFYAGIIYLYCKVETIFKHLKVLIFIVYSEGIH